MKYRKGDIITIQKEIKSMMVTFLPGEKVKIVGVDRVSKTYDIKSIQNDFKWMLDVDENSLT